MVMPVSPLGGYGNNGFGGDGWWIILLFLLVGANGWGNGFGGGYGGGAGYVDSSIQRGFDQSAVMSGISGLTSAVTSGFGDVQTALCGGFAGVNAAIAGAQSATAAQMYSNQIADLERSFAAQTANTQAITGLSSQLAQCCCDNRLATCQTQNIVQNEGNATRFAEANNTRDIIDSQNKNSQMILDKLCALELDGYKRENDNLRSQLNMATLRESQTAQNAFIAQGFSNEVDQLYTRLSNCPVPSVPVYGRQNIFQCNQNSGCGCGCGA
jgi:hypothetical protein